LFSSPSSKKIRSSPSFRSSAKRASYSSFFSGENRRTTPWRFPPSTQGQGRTGRTDARDEEEYAEGRKTGKAAFYDEKGNPRRKGRRRMETTSSTPRSRGIRGPRRRTKAEIGKVIVGQPDLVDSALQCISATTTRC